MRVIENKRLLCFAQTKAFLAGCFLSVLVGMVVWTYATTVEGRAGVRQRTVLEAMRKQIQLNGALPSNLSKLGCDWAKQYMSYRPKAWNKPGKILLLSRGVRSYIVTFGDSSHAVLVDYDSRHLEDEGCYLSRTSSGGYLMFIIVGLPLLFFVAVMFVERIATKKLFCKKSTSG